MLRFLMVICLLLSTISIANSTVSLDELDVFNIMPKIKAGTDKLFGDPAFRAIPMIFDPKDGTKLQYYFQKIYGIRGQDLIKALGAGIPLNKLKLFDTDENYVTVWPGQDSKPWSYEYLQYKCSSLHSTVPVPVELFVLNKPFLYLEEKIGLKKETKYVLR